MRDAPSIIVINDLIEAGAKIKLYDPIALENAKHIFRGHGSKIQFVQSAYEAVNKSDVMIVLTEWNEFRQLDLQKIKSTMRSPNIVDGRNIYDPSKVKQLGFQYLGVGR